MILGMVLFMGGYIHGLGVISRLNKSQKEEVLIWLLPFLPPVILLMEAVDGRKDAMWALGLQVVGFAIMAAPKVLGS